MVILSVIGTRPQFIRLAHFHKEFSKYGLTHIVIDTAQHFDTNLSTNFFLELGIPAPERLPIPQGRSQVLRLSDMLVNLESKFNNYNHIDAVIVYGDTDSTLAGAIWAKRNGRILVHVESGLRSRNRLMPEEVNRVIVDHLSDLRLAPTSNALANLRNEGLSESSVVVGDILLDALNDWRKTLPQSNIDTFWVEHGIRSPEKFFVCTLHRAELIDSREDLRRVFRDLSSTSIPLVIVQHPRLRKMISLYGIEFENPLVKLSEPLSHEFLLALIWHSSGVLTDSGGLQRESANLGIPTMIVRKETEWVELLSMENVLLSYETRDWESKLQSLPRLFPNLKNSQAASGYSIRKIKEFITKEKGKV